MEPGSGSSPDSPPSCRFETIASPLHPITTRVKYFLFRYQIRILSYSSPICTTINQTSGYDNSIYINTNNNNADACHVLRFVTDPLFSSRNSAGRLNLFISTAIALTSSIPSALNSGMSQETQSAALYSQQREAGPVRTALPSRPMSSKPGSPAPPSQERTRLPTGQESHDHRQRLSGSPPGSQTSPTLGTMSKQQSPGAEHSSKASPPPGSGGSQGQVCR